MWRQFLSQFLRLEPFYIATVEIGTNGEEAFGRPVGVAIAKDGALLVADDVGNAVWRPDGLMEHDMYVMQVNKPSESKGK